jgi:hypothetical protein
MRAADLRRQGHGPCPADFFGEHLEALVCGSHSERAERLHPNISPGDASVMLHEIASGLPTAVKALTDRGATQSSFAIQQERDVQDLLFVILRSLFPDARREELAPSHAGSSKRIDLVIPSGRTVVEVKFVRDRSHGRRVADELKIDIESYHGHPACGTLFVLVWDENRHLADPQQLERDRPDPGRRAAPGSTSPYASSELQDRESFGLDRCLTAAVPSPRLPTPTRPPTGLVGPAFGETDYLFDSGRPVFAGDCRQGRCTAAGMATRPGWVAPVGLRPVGLGLAIRLR